MAVFSVDVYSVNDVFSVNQQLNKFQETFVPIR